MYNAPDIFFFHALAHGLNISVRAARSSIASLDFGKAVLNFIVRTADRSVIFSYTVLISI